MQKVLLFFGFLLPLFLQAQTDTTWIKYSNPASVSKPKGYSHAVEINFGKSKMLIISGQVALDSAGNLVGKDDPGKQTEKVFQNIAAILQSHGATMDDIVKISVFLKDISHVPVFRTIRDQYVNKKNPPASTLVEVSSFVRSDLLIEIEATAIINKK